MQFSDGEIDVIGIGGIDMDATTVKIIILAAIAAELE